MHELWIAAAAFGAGAAMAATAGWWHYRQLSRAAEQQALAARNLEDDRNYYRERLAALQAQASLDAAYDEAYVAGIRQGAELNDAERLAYSLEQKKPERILRMGRYRQGEKEARHA